MRLIQLAKFLGDTLNRKVYPLQFPHNEDEECVVLDIINSDFEGDMKTSNFQLMVRSSHPAIGEDVASSLIESLHNITNRVCDSTQIILIQCTNPNPFFNGQDDNERYLYTVDFRVLSTEI